MVNALNQQRFSVYRLVFTVIFGLGIIVRILPVLLSGFNLPFEFGGLYVEFAHQIAENHFALPANIPYYTDGGIPFAYPPLPFYIEAILIYSFHLPVFLVNNLLPSILAILGLPFFYILVKAILKDSTSRIFTLTAFALMPVAFSNQIEAAGLAEASGTLALIWWGIALAKTWKEQTWKAYLLSGILWAVCVVSSPGSAYGSVFVFFIFILAELARSKWKLTRLRLIKWVALGGLASIVSAPYWLTVILQNGVTTFTGSFFSQNSGLLIKGLFSLYHFNVSGGGFAWDAIIFFGLVLAVLRRHWALLAVFFLLFFIPREGEWLIALPAAFLFGIAGKAIIEGIRQNEQKLHGNQIETAIINGILIIAAAAYLLGSPIYLIKSKLEDQALTRLTPAGMQALEWMQQNTPADSRWIILAQPQVQEWAPQLSRRTEVNVKYGTEWRPDLRNTVVVFNNAAFEGGTTLDILESRADKAFGRRDFYYLVDKTIYAQKQEISIGGMAHFAVLWENNEFVIGQILTQ